MSGPPGSGTTSLAKYLARRYGLTIISAGEVFRQLAEERGMDLAAFGALAESDPSIDRVIDERQKEIGERSDDIVVEGRLSGWMVENADLKIWLTASAACRAKRVAGRDAVVEEAAVQQTEQREACEAARYRAYYGIDINAITPYHMVLNSEFWTADELGAIVDTAISFLKRQPSSHPPGIC
ncbi:cytidylate kinase [hydrocarbon metagenome]|uniref:(d)CMP kinase n=1 Tax=hydrocarbon metagenome TaxID=938273 RepID=A0A0W8FHM7_9ZZZZ